MREGGVWGFARAVSWACAGRGSTEDEWGMGLLGVQERWISWERDRMQLGGGAGAGISGRGSCERGSSGAAVGRGVKILWCSRGTVIDGAGEGAGAWVVVRTREHGIWWESEGQESRRGAL